MSLKGKSTKLLILDPSEPFTFGHFNVRHPVEMLSHRNFRGYHQGCVNLIWYLPLIEKKVNKFLVCSEQFRAARRRPSSKVWPFLSSFDLHRAFLWNYRPWSLKLKAYFKCAIWKPLLSSGIFTNISFWKIIRFWQLLTFWLEKWVKPNNICKCIKKHYRFVNNFEKVLLFTILSLIWTEILHDSISV